MEKTCFPPFGKKNCMVKPYKNNYPNNSIIFFCVANKRKKKEEKKKRKRKKKRAMDTPDPPKQQQQQNGKEEEEEEKMCRYCFGNEEDGPLVSPCACLGGQKYVHMDCLKRWQRMVLVSQPTHPAFYTG